MSHETSGADRFGAFAVRTGLEENDPTLVQAVKALQQFKAGEFTAEETDAALGPIFEAWIKKIREAPPRMVAIPVEVDPNIAVFLEMLTWQITV